MFSPQTINCDEILLLQKAMDSTVVGISLADCGNPDMPLIYVNEGFERMTGYTAAEVLGKNCRFLQGDYQNDEARASIKQAIANQTSCKVILKNFRKNGEFFWNELHLTPIFNSVGELTHYAGIQHDVTKREVLTENIRIRKEILVEANKKLLKLSKDKNKLLSTVSHDLRLPLANLSGLLSLIRDTQEEAVREIYISMSEQSIAKANDLINDYLNYEAIQSGKVQIDKREVDVEKFAIRIGDYFESEANNKNIKLHISSRLDYRKACFDEDRIDQVAVNLFTNALKFSPRGSNIYLRFINSEDSFCIQLEDEGQGIKKEELTHLFDAFSQTSSKSTEGEQGFGLGLSIVKKIVNLHGGRVQVESEWGVGTCFTVILPRLPQDKKKSQMD